MNTQLLEEARRLPPDDQIELIAALWGNIIERGSVSLPTDAQKMELDRRLAEHLKNPDDVISWDEVKASLQFLVVFQKCCWAYLGKTVNC